MTFAIKFRTHPPPNDTFPDIFYPIFSLAIESCIYEPYFALGKSQVADMVKAKDSNVDMRCIFDGLDFIPTEVNKSCFYIHS